MPRLVSGRFAQVPVEFAHPKRHADSLRREQSPRWREDGGLLLQAAGRKRYVRGDCDVELTDMLGDPVVGRIGAFGHGYVANVRMRARTQAAIAHHGDEKTVPARDAL